MWERKIGGQIECAPLCLALLSNMDAVRLGRPCDTVGEFQSKLRLPTLEALTWVPIKEACCCKARCRGTVDHIICHPAWADPPPTPSKRNFSAETLWLETSQSSSTSQNKEIMPQ